MVETSLEATARIMFGEWIPWNLIDGDRIIPNGDFGLRRDPPSGEMGAIAMELSSQIPNQEALVGKKLWWEKMSEESRDILRTIYNSPEEIGRYSVSSFTRYVRKRLKMLHPEDSPTQRRYRRQRVQGEIINFLEE